MRKLIVLIAAFGGYVSVQAQGIRFTVAEDTTKAKELAEVVVTGQYKPQSVKNSVYQIKVIGKERILQQGATRLQDVLRTELNMRFSQDLSTGGSSINMLGLAGQNVKILVDGLPVTGRQGINNEFDISQIDINSIERVEIVEGPMSVIYGADALAGVINIITKKSTAAGWSVTARLHEETVGREYGWERGIHNQQAGFSWKRRAWDAGASFAHTYFGGWKDTAVGRELVWHKKDQRLANAFLGYSKGKLNLRYRVEGLDEVISNPGNYASFPERISGDTLAYDQDYLSKRLMHQLQGSLRLNPSLGFQLQSAYTDYSREVFSTTLNKATGDRRLDPGDGKQSLVRFRSFTVRGTAVYKISEQLSMQPGLDINLDRGRGERLQDGSNAVDDYAFFLTAEYTPTGNISIRPGLRVIRNSVYDAPPVIPSLNTRWAFSPALDLRVSYARGFRSPSLRELYFSFFDANHQVVGNPGLKAETSHSFTGSLNWKMKTKGNKAISAQLGGFYNDVDNLIDFVFTPASDTARLYNVFNSRTTGVNFTGKYAAGNWQLNAGAAWTGFYNEQYENDKSLPAQVWSPEFNATLAYRFPVLGLDLNLYYKLTGKRPRYVTSGPDIILSKQDAFHMADFTVSKKISSLFGLHAGVRNIFDVSRISSTFVQGGIHSSGAMNVATGRSCFASLVFNWNKNNQQ